MRISNIETFIVDAGWRPWGFVKVETDEGITGWGECSDGRSPQGVAATIADLEPILLGQDPREFETRFWDLYRGVRSSFATGFFFLIYCILLFISSHH